MTDKISFNIKKSSRQEIELIQKCFKEINGVDLSQTQAILYAISIAAANSKKILDDLSNK